MNQFGDDDLLDAVCDEDPALEDVDWEKVASLQARIDEVQAIEDEGGRMAAAVALDLELDG